MSRGHAHALHLHGHSPVHRLEPEVKVAAHLAFVLAVVATPRERWWAFALHAALLAAVLLIAEIPAGFFARRVAVEVPFVLFALMLPFLGGGPTTEVVGLELSREGLWGMWNILAKATLGVGASVVLIATTEIPHLLRGLERLRVPRLLIAIAGFMIRYLDVIAGELGRMRIAMAARGYRPRWLGQAGALGTAGGALFVRSFERGERVHQAMAARGFRGTMPDPRRSPATPVMWLQGLSVPLMAWLTATVAIVA